MDVFELDIRYGRKRECFEADAFSFDYFKGRELSKATKVSFSTPLWCKAKTPSQEGPLFDFLWNSYAIPLVSELAVRAIHEIDQGGEYELFPIAVIDSRGETVASYNVLNILTVYDAIDFDQSDLTFSERIDPISGKPYIGFANKLVVDRQRIGGAALFRLARYCQPMFCSDGIAHKLQSKQLTGVRPVKVLCVD
jgi:hypothetical protein